MGTPISDGSRASGIRDTAEAFVRAFIFSSPPTETLDKYFAPDAKILEHGPAWASERLPFLGITFQGRRSQGLSTRTCDDYYDLLNSVLSFNPSKDTTPTKEDFMVDPQTGTVTVKLRATFASIKTGRSWEEQFVYVLSEFDENYKIGSHELWADPLSAWMAVGD